MNLDKITVWMMAAAAVAILIGVILVHVNWLATTFAFTGAAFAWRCV